jgi:hypothetical protein
MGNQRTATSCVIMTNSSSVLAEIEVWLHLAFLPFRILIDIPGRLKSAARYQQVWPYLTEVLLDQCDNLPVIDIFRLLQRRHAVLVPDIQSCAIFQQYCHHLAVSLGNGQMQRGFQLDGLCIGVRSIMGEQFTQIDMAKTGCIVQGCAAGVGSDDIHLGSIL